jgi:photosystem II stability/assembly factor-like uncharacterized protein
MALFAVAPMPSAGQAQETDPALFSEMEWRNIGPFRGGRSVAATGVTSLPYTYYMGGVGSGVWKTTNAGQSWENISDDTFGTSSVGAIAVAETDPNVVYVGMGEHAPRGVMTSHGDGIYKSTDAGHTWRHMGLPNSRAISDVIIHPADENVVYVSVQGAPYGFTEDRGVYRTTDGGETWDKVLYVSDRAGASSLSMDPNNPRILYAGFWEHLRQGWTVQSGGEGSGLWRTMDGGDTWETVGEDDFPELMGKIGVDVAGNSDRIYALIEADPGGGLYRSDDRGESWELVSDFWSLRARAWYYIEVFADPQDPNVVWVLNAPVFKSIDGGENFERVPTPHGDNHDLWINPTNSQYLVNANDGGANVSLDGGANWSTQQNQPTAQFYRVNVDNQFPYMVYGGQQDNSTVAIASRTFSGGIGWKDWHAVGGCESAYTGFDRDNPRYVYAGCYMGQISEWDAATRYSRNVMAYPQLPIAMQARDMKYRFNWNAPILVSQHDTDVIYHGGNHLLRSGDRGRTWEEASPDLTRDEDTKQGFGGGPITNEGAGGEIYGTLAYVAESPHDANTVWAGSDDGLVHVTQDGGATWTDVTPEGVPESLINSIEVSPHDPAAAYVAVNLYKFNDFTPHILKTTDYGQSWERVVNGIAEEHHVRVVREDPVRRGLLYAGTEQGVYVSFDDGANWQSLMLNMPITYITDLIVQPEMNDLVASTGGRSFWILDDLGPLQAASADIAADGVHLYQPRTAYRTGGGGFGGFGGNVGQNPPQGAIIDFYLAETDSTDVTLEILDGEDVIRTYTTAFEPGDRGARLEVEAGMNRTNWDLRHESAVRVPDLYVWGSHNGRKVVPGTYQVRLTAGDEVRTASVDVRKDPRTEATQADFEEQDALMVALTTELNEMHESVVAVMAVDQQIGDVLEQAEEYEGEGVEVVKESGEALSESLEAVKDSIIQERTVDGQTVLNAESRLNLHYIYLRSAVDQAEAGTTRGAHDFYQDLTTRWAVQRAEVDRLLGPELDDFNEAVRESGMPAVITNRTPRSRPVSD